jgi:lysophospholipid acyltransferase (LPLAT)-like uncharacterized protein
VGRFELDYGPARDAAAFACNALVYATTLATMRTVRIEWTPRPDRLIELVRGTERPLFFYGWHSNGTASFVAFRCAPAAIKPVPIGHDGYASRLMHMAGSWHGHDVLVYRRRADIAARDQIIAFLTETRRSVLLFPDSGGPYWKLKPGLLDIARAGNAWLVPFDLGLRPPTWVGGAMKHLVPLPFARIEIFTGEPIDSRGATLEECQEALESLTPPRPA